MPKPKGKQSKQRAQKKKRSKAQDKRVSVRSRRGSSGEVTTRAKTQGAEGQDNEKAVKGTQETQSNKNDSPAQLTGEQLAVLLAKASGEDIQSSDIPSNAPRNEDGTIHFLHYAAWLINDGR